MYYYYANKNYQSLATIFLICLFLIGNGAQSDVDKLKFYVTTDRNIYTVGDNLYYSIYSQSASFQHTISKPCYVTVDFIGRDSTIYISQKIRIEQKCGIGDFNLSLDWPTGKYMIRLTAGDFTYRQTIFVYGLAKEQDDNDEDYISIVPRISFYPSGGYLVKGLSCLMGIKAEDQFGNPLQIHGWAGSASGKKVSEFATDSFGFAKVNIVPDAALVFASVVFEADTFTYSLPESLDRGYVCELRDQNEDEVFVLLQSNLPKGLEGAKITLGQQDRIIHTHHFSEFETSMEYVFSAQGLYAGVFTITLLDPLDQPVAEVLGFHYVAGSEVFLDATIEQQDDSISVLLESYNYDGDLIPTDLSISIVDQRYARSIFDKDVRTYFLLESSLSDLVRDPVMYFDEGQSDSRELMQDLLLCQGWRRNGRLSLESDRLSKMDTCLKISGRTTVLGDPDKGVQARGFVSDLSETFDFIPFQTDENGYFEIGDLQLEGLKNLFFQAERYNGKKSKDRRINKLSGNRQVSIQVLKKSVSQLTTTDFDRLNRVEKLNTSFDFLADNSGVIKQAQDSWDGMSVTFDTVQVSAQKLDPIVEYHKDAMQYTRPNQRIFMDPIHGTHYRTIFDLIRSRVNNATITGLSGSGDLYRPQSTSLTIANSRQSGPKIVFRGGSSSLSSATAGNGGASFTINGAIVSAETVQNIAIENVAFVDVIRDLSSLALYGEAGSGGIIAIYLKQGLPSELSDVERPGTLHHAFEGYYEAREFIQPNERLEQPEKQPSSPTLFWHPKIELAAGEGRLKIAKSSREGPFILSIEGMTRAGEPVAMRRIIEMR